MRYLVHYEILRLNLFPTYFSLVILHGNCGMSAASGGVFHGFWITRNKAKEGVDFQFLCCYMVYMGC